MLVNFNNANFVSLEGFNIKYRSKQEVLFGFYYDNEIREG